MSVSTDVRSPHPTASDFVNVALEKVGQKKTQRILEHCKQCPDCANALLEAVRDVPVVREPIKLSKWNWISIGFLVISLVVVFAALLWFLGSAADAVPDR